MRKYPELPKTTGELEDEVLGRWKAEDTFRASLARSRERMRAAGERPFVF